MMDVTTTYRPCCALVLFVAADRTCHVNACLACLCSSLLMDVLLHACRGPDRILCMVHDLVTLSLLPKQFTAGDIHQLKYV